MNLQSEELVPAGNSTNPVISSGFLRCGPALTGTATFGATGAGFGVSLITGA